MAEIRRGIGGEGLANERLPWLEPVEDEDDYPEPGSGGGRLLLWIVIALAAVAILLGAFVYWTRYRAAHADIGTVIHAPPGPYKEKPANPGGLAVSESDVITARMGTGTDIDSPLDLAKVPEQPVVGANRDPDAAPPPTPVSAPAQNPAPVPAKAGLAPAPARAPVVAPVAVAPIARTPAPLPVTKAPPPAPVKPAPVPAAATGGGTIQLGALASEAKAKQVWKTLLTRFDVLAPLAMSITPVKLGDTTLYRLRASGGDARKLCAELKVAGESCTVVP